MTATYNQVLEEAARACDRVAARVFDKCVNLYPESGASGCLIETLDGVCKCRECKAGAVACAAAIRELKT